MSLSCLKPFNAFHCMKNEVANPQICPAVICLMHILIASSHASPTFLASCSHTNLPSVPRVCLFLFALRPWPRLFLFQTRPLILLTLAYPYPFGLNTKCPVPSLTPCLSVVFFLSALVITFLPWIQSKITSSADMFLLAPHLDCPRAWGHVCRGILSCVPSVYPAPYMCLKLGRYSIDNWMNELKVPMARVKLSMLEYCDLMQESKESRELALPGLLWVYFSVMLWPEGQGRKVFPCTRHS